MAGGDAYVFPDFITPVLTQLLFSKPLTPFLTCFCRGERRKYARKKSSLNRGSNSQPPGHESDTLTTEPPRQGLSKQRLTNKLMSRQTNKLNNTQGKNYILLHLAGEACKKALNLPEN